MTIKDNHINRYGESHIKPPDEDEYGMVRDKNIEAVDWNHDPRSESSSEKHYGKGPKGWLPDHAIKKNASLALYLNPYVDAREIVVSVESGCVILKGFIKNRFQKKAAERCVETVPGVVDVYNELILQQVDIGPRYKL